MESLVALVTWMVLELLLTAFLAAVYEVLRRFMKASADRYLFLKLSFAVVIFLPLLPVPALEFFSSTSPSALSVQDTGSLVIKVASENAALKVPFLTPLILGLATAYGIAVLIMFARIFASSVKLTTLAEAAKVVTSRNGVPVLVTEAKLPPATFGWIKPIILIPSTVLNRISADELEMILAHEEQHIQRRDYLYNLLRAVVQTVVVFSPWIHWLGRRFVEDMELSCDALTIERSQCSPKAYGSMLFRLGASSRPRKDLVFSGLFVSHSFLSKRIIDMNNFRRKRNRIVPLAGFICLSLFIGPALVSLGINEKINSALVTGDSATKEGQVVYRSVISRKNKPGESVSGTIYLEDGAVNTIRVGSVELMLRSKKEGQNWHLTLQGYDEASKSIIWNSALVMHDTAGATLESKIDNYANGDVSGISFSLSPLVRAKRKVSNPGLVEADNGKVYLHFKRPTEVRDLIKTIARLTGKNVILDHNVQGKVTIDHANALAKDEAYKAFLQAFNLLNLDVIETERSIKIIDKRKAG